MDVIIMAVSGKLFKDYCGLVYRETGIALNKDKKELLNARIAKILRVQNIKPAEYLNIIQQNPAELRVFLDAISTNHTYFFRESKTFKYLEKSCKKIWCAASSSGEEPYSLAMYCLEKGFQPSIKATDISDTCLRQGREGVYPDKNITGIPKQLLRTYFQKGRGKMQGHFKVKQGLGQMVDFQRFNLLKDHPENEVWDIIFCRNVMIYFDMVVKSKVVAKLSSVLRPNGYFIIGGAESLNGLDHKLKYIEPSVYQKINK